ncbi:predicted protein [Uncinocarpus reesii 1704]|uniref:mRNA-capping enzyme subunit beta n=1 Tax=Uncinocarpus reesii (strain UAMH 1704) TaxID=336963 RepID=C4JHU5_UNCRE|nr:uncharacterized protein UREG_02781 [Uncinocarpus reesii 1704]EEP77932.1 predicted protein [Uncinocarpus reesii 1704]
MDLRTIMNADSAGVSSKPPPPQPLPPSPLQQPGRELSPRRTSYPNDASPPSHPSLPTEPRARPPPPPPLQPPLHSPGRSSSYGSAQSPYQHSSASSILNSIPPPPNNQAHPHGSQSFLPVARDSFATTAASVPHPTSSLCSPFTPQPLSSGTQQSYFSQTRSHSIHSATTPSSVRSFSFPAPREDAAIPQHAEPSQPLPYSPIQTGSQPATPLGPPSATFRRRPPSSGQDVEHGPIASAWDRGDQQREQKDAVSPIMQTQLSRQGSLLVEQPHRQYLLERDIDRHRTSVSPKTILNRANHAAGDLGRVPERSSQTQYNNDVDKLSWRTNNGGTNNLPAHDNDTASQNLYPPTTPKTTHPSNSSHPSTVSPPSKQTIKRETESSSQHITPMKPSEPLVRSSVTPTLIPRKKRKRYHEPPVYAQKAPRTTGTPPTIPISYKSAASSLPFKPPFPKREAPEERPTSRNRSLPPRPTPLPAQERPDANENSARSSTVGKPVSSLGPWEPSITGIIPHEEVTKAVCDFLFQQVVMRKDIGAGPAGGAATGSGAILEVEAKLGQLVDKNRGERIRLPVLTECILSKDDPGLRIAFESSMSLAQHRSLNNFLNESVKASMAPGASRIPLTYAHKKELDTFYEVSSSALPPIVQHHLNPRHKPKDTLAPELGPGIKIA